MSFAMAKDNTALLIGGGVALGVVALYLLTRDTKSDGDHAGAGGCDIPPTPEVPAGAPPGDYTAIAILWNPSTCKRVPGPNGNDEDALNFTKAQADEMRARVGKPVESGTSDVPAGMAGWFWIFDDHGALYFTGTRKGSGPLLEAHPKGGER